ncbi:hypothetical protein EEL32_20565 [Brevibacillus laterosporus]|nr:hypothetical protein EEL32_20565 [Brevibacillus laterosporus]
MFKVAKLTKVFKFTNCGATGRNGANQTQVDQKYSGTTLDKAVTSVNGVHQWTVPMDGEYIIEAFGAQGGQGNPSANPPGWIGGKGAKMKGKFKLKKGTVLNVVVGQMGQTGFGNYNCAGAGGGGSFVYHGDIGGDGLLIAAGGGGGSQGNGSRVHGTVNRDGNMGGNGTNDTPQYSGDGGIDGMGGSSVELIEGMLYQGGGYSGGGGAYYTTGNGGGGGSYNAGTEQVGIPETNSGHGMVIISFNIDEEDIPEGFKMDFYNTGTGISGNLQKFIVPRGGIYKISASGARGGNVGGNLGGKGAFVSGEFNLDEGDTIHLLVGHMGLDKPFSDYGGGGGGGSFAVKQDNDSSYIFKPLNVGITPLVIAGGGGGAGDNGGNFSGGAGNGETTGNGGGGTGLQGNRNSGGSGFIGDAKPSDAKSPISFLNGGTGGTRGTYWGGFGGGGLPFDAGGGGGGYTGGNGGEGVKGGFGGSSYNTGLNQIRQSGVNNGHGKIEITFIKPTSPKITAVIEPTTVHAENVKLDLTIDDPNDLSVNYKIFINDMQKEPSNGFTDPVRPPFRVSFIISNLDLISGNNIIAVVASNTEGVETTKKFEVVKQNSSPLITDGVIEGSYLRAKITDEDNDKIRYRIVVNELQLFPHRGFSKLIQTPVSIEYGIPKNLIKLNQSNTVLIEAMDSVGTLSLKEFTATMGYTGMMFTTRDGEFYSTDLGEVLKYLDMGRVLAGSEPVIYEVFLKNTTGIPMKRPKLWVDQKDLNPVSEKIELSKTKEPFEPTEKINFGQDYEMAHNQSVPFYVRVKTTEDAVGGGKFDIWVSADPL